MDRRTLLDGLGAVGIGSAALFAAGGVAEAKESAVTGRRLMQAFATTLSAHDIAGFAALIADDYKQHQTIPGGGSLPPGVTAKQAAVNYFAARLKALPDLKVTAEAITAGGDMAAANFVYTGTQQDAYFGVPATNKNVTFNSTDIFRIRNGKLAEHWGAADIAGLMRQLKG
jgi:steroid delta-isomerase-like uncharacterized protein